VGANGFQRKAAWKVLLAWHYSSDAPGWMENDTVRTRMPVRSAARPWRVFVVDDRMMPRIAARAMLAGVSDLLLVGEASSGSEAIELISRTSVDVVLMDVDMSEMDGAETTRRLLETQPSLTVLAWTVSDAGDDLL